MYLQSTKTDPQVTEFRQTATSGPKTRSAVSDKRGLNPVQPSLQEAKKETEVTATKVKIEPADMESVVEEINKVASRMNTDLAFSVDRDLDQVIVRITRGETDELVRQLPTEEMVRLAKKMKELGFGGEPKGMLLNTEG